MKRMRLVLLLMLLAPLFFLYSAAQQPAISGKYSNQEIEKMMQDFKRERSHDVRPTEQLVQKFKKDFPGARDVEWEKAAALYEVEFEIKRVDYLAYYDGMGNLIMFKHDIRLSALPDPVKKQAKALYPNYRFDDVEKIMKGTEVLYKIEMERGDAEVKILIKKDGTVVNNARG